jgi:hypothetical protein
MNIKGNSIIKTSAVSLAVFAAAVAATPAKATDLVLNDWLNKVTISGDLRLRNERWDNTCPDGRGCYDYSRDRFRLRLALGFEFSPDLMAKVRLDSGNGDQASANQTETAMSTEKPLWIGQAYMKWRVYNGDNNATLSLMGGKMENPLWTIAANNMVWEPSVNPEGYAEKATYKYGQANLFLNAMQMAADNDKTIGDQWLFAQQLGAQVPLSDDFKATVAGAWYAWANTDANSLTNGGNPVPASTSTGYWPGNAMNAYTNAGIPLNKFGVGEVTAELAGKVYGYPISVQGSYINNMRSNSALTGTGQNQTGYKAGVIFNKAAEKNSWELGYFYKYVESEATVASLTETDWGAGGTNLKGSCVWAAYNPYKNFQLRSAYYMTSLVDTSLPYVVAANSGVASSTNKLQLDAIISF